MKKFKREKKQNKKIDLKFNLFINFILLAAIPVILISITVAKYLQEEENDIVFESNAFYFNSNLLSEDQNSSTYTYSKGEDIIQIDLINNLDELRYSEVDIKYEVKITDIYGNSVKDKSGKTISSITGTLSKNTVDTEIVEFTNLATGNYLITATSLEPYKKTIQGLFNITEGNKELTLSVNDSQESPILQVTVLSEDYSGNIVLTWPEGVAPDSTNKLLETANQGYAGGEIEINFEANSEYTFKFFKEEPNLVYTKNDFNVERSN